MGQHYSVINLKGGINCRDLGGIETIDGRKVKANLLLRSGDLHQLVEGDAAQLAAMPVRHIIDYRDDTEAQIKPDILWDGVTYHHAPANPMEAKVSADLSLLGDDSDFDPNEYMLDLYRLLPFNNQAYQQLVDLLLSCPDGALIQHCAIGKDRTGVGVALTLLALGVPLERVKQDYLLTNETLAPVSDKYIASVSSRLSGKAVEGLRTVFAAKEMFFMAAIDAIYSKYENIEDWLAQEYGLTEDKRQLLQRHYLSY